MARAAEKREARRLRKRGRAAQLEESGEPDAAAREPEATEDLIPDDTTDKV